MNSASSLPFLFKWRCTDAARHARILGIVAALGLSLATGSANGQEMPARYELLFGPQPSVTVEAVEKLVAAEQSLPAASNRTQSPVKASTLRVRLKDMAEAGVEATQRVGAAVGAGVTTVGRSAGDLVTSAMSLIGVPYRWGGQSVEDGFDCSGLIRHVFESAAGLILPRTAAEQARHQGMAKIDKSKLEPGDLVFFNTRRAKYSHVGIYVGEGKFVHAPRRGATVRVDALDAKYWRTRFDGARRPKDSRI